jgi:hypothetical protein
MTTEINGNIQAAIELLRNEPWRVLPFSSNCVGKSLRLKKICKRQGVQCRVVVMIGYAHNKKVRWLPSVIPDIHGWAEINNERVELAHGLDQLNTFGTYDIDIRPLFGIWI